VTETIVYLGKEAGLLPKISHYLTLPHLIMAQNERW